MPGTKDHDRVLDDFDQTRASTSGAGDYVRKAPGHGFAIP
jgi:hypothetical protein